MADELAFNFSLARVRVPLRFRRSERNLSYASTSSDTRTVTDHELLSTPARTSPTGHTGVLQGLENSGGTSGAPAARR